MDRREFLQAAGCVSIAPLAVAESTEQQSRAKMLSFHDEFSEAVVKVGDRIVWMESDDLVEHPFGVYTLSLPGVPFEASTVRAEVDGVRRDVELVDRYGGGKTIVVE